MKWFTGSINEAVATSKSRKAIFVVFVAGEDDGSIQAAKVIDSQEITSRLEQDDFVAIRLESGSESYKFFAQIYQLVPVPSLFFIGDNGTPLEVIAGDITVPNLQVKINAVLESVGKAQSTSNDFIKAEQSSTSVQNTGSYSGSSAAVTSPITVTSNAAESSASAANDQVENSSAKKLDEELSPEEKIERAKKLIELQRQQKAEKDREAEKILELERRKMGRDVQLARQKQQELEVKLAHEERKREKALETEARERVRQQIAQDRLDRKQREQAMQQSIQKEPVEQPPQPVAVPVDGMARIQFRLPSDTPHMGKFEVNSTLGELRSYVSNNITLPFRQFSMSTSFPRRDLSIDDDYRTLLELELVPTAVILILPAKNSKSLTTAPGSPDGFLSRFMWVMFTPILSVYNYFASYFTQGPVGGENRGESSGSSLSGGASSQPSTAGQASGFRNGNFGRPNSTLRARGNIHRLHSEGQDNDENNTWNGNSTQQM